MSGSTPTEVGRGRNSSAGSTVGWHIVGFLPAEFVSGGRIGRGAGLDPPPVPGGWRRSRERAGQTAVRPAITTGSMPSMHPMGGDYRLGLTTLGDEIAVDQLPVRGELPPWLAGTLIRNGPAMFDHAGKSFRHWFD